MGERLNFCLHESAHSVARQLIIGDLGQVGLKKRYAYYYPIERRPYCELSKEELTKIAVVVAAGIAAEYGLCSSGLGASKERAVSDDLMQFKEIQRICSFSNEEMQAFVEEACGIIESYETVIRKVATELNRKTKLTGEQVTQLMEKHLQNCDYVPAVRTDRGLSQRYSLPAIEELLAASVNRNLVRIQT